MRYIKYFLYEVMKCWALSLRTCSSMSLGHVWSKMSIYEWNAGPYKIINLKQEFFIDDFFKIIWDDFWQFPAYM